MFDFLFNPQGRISRKGFWLGFFLPYLAITLVLSLAEQAVPLLSILSVLVGLFYFWPSLVAVPAKRLHDLGRSGWWLALYYGLFLVAIIVFGAAVGYYMAGPGAENAEAMATMTPEETQALFVESIPLALRSGVGIAGAAFIAVLFVGYYVVMGLLPGQRADNKHGRDPLAEGRGFAD